MFIIGRSYNDRKNGKGHETLKQIIRMSKLNCVSQIQFLDVNAFEHLFKLED